MRPPYICFWFFGTLGGLFLVWFLVFENFEIVFGIQIPTFWGGSNLQNLLIWGLLIYVFLIFGTLGSLIWVWFLVSENFKIVFWIRIPSFGGVYFIKLFDLRPPHICFWFLLTLRVFLVWFLVRKFRNCILNQNSYFWWGLFYKTFWFEVSLYGILIFQTLVSSLKVFFLKISKLYFESEFSLWGGLFYETFWGFLDDFIHSSRIIF